MKFLLTVLLLACGTSAFSAPSLESYGMLEQVSNVSISPNGELIAFRRTLSDKEDHIVVLSIKDNKQVAGVGVASINPQGIYFASDRFLVLKGSKHVSFRAYKHDFDASTAYSLDITNNKAEVLLKLGQRLGKDRSIRAGQSGMGRVVGKSSDGATLYMPAFVDDKSRTEEGIYSLLEVGLDDERGRPRVASRGAKHVIDYFLDNTGKVLARERLNQRTNKHSIEVKDGSKWRSIYSYEATVPTHSFVGLNNDFSALIFARDDDGESWLQLSLKDGEVSRMEGFDTSRSSSLLTNNHRVVEGVSYSGFSPDYKMFDAALDKRLQEIMKLFAEHSVYLSDWSDDWQHIVVRVEGSQHAGDYFLFSEGEEVKFLVSSRFDIDSEDINPIGVTRFKARDGLMIPTLVTLPKSKAGNWKNLPTVILPHGGPAAHDSLGFDYMAQALASRGILVVQPQFRGSTGFGSELEEAGLGQWGAGMQNDLTDAVEAFVGKAYTDVDRVCIVGASYGGYAALAGASFTPDLYKCAASIAGVSHLPKMIAADRSRHGRGSWVVDYWKKNITAEEAGNKQLKTLSPYFSADKVKIPVLLLHGEDDTVVEYEQSRLMHKALKKAGAKSQLVKLKNDDHYLQQSSTRIQAVKAMVGFVEKHIGD